MLTTASVLTTRKIASDTEVHWHWQLESSLQPFQMLRVCASAFQVESFLPVGNSVNFKFKLPVASSLPVRRQVQVATHWQAQAQAATGSGTALAVKLQLKFKLTCHKTTRPAAATGTGTASGRAVPPAAGAAAGEDSELSLSRDSDGRLPVFQCHWQPQADSECQWQLRIKSPGRRPHWQR